MGPNRIRLRATGSPRRAAPNKTAAYPELVRTHSIIYNALIPTVKAVRIRLSFRSLCTRLPEAVWFRCVRCARPPRAVDEENWRGVAHPRDWVWRRRPENATSAPTLQRPDATASSHMMPPYDAPTNAILSWGASNPPRRTTSFINSSKALRADRMRAGSSGFRSLLNH